MKTFKIHLIRHGMTDANLCGQYIGNRTDLPLCPQGVTELMQLKEEISYPDIEKLYTSPMLRCKQSCHIIYPDFEPAIIDELTEYDFGEFEGKTAESLEMIPEYKEWTSGKIDSTPGGESNSNFIKRLALGLNMVVRDMMKNDITDAAVMMHGGAIMMLLASCAVPRRHSVEWAQENGRGYSVIVTPSLYHSSGIIEVYDII